MSTVKKAIKNNLKAIIVTLFIILVVVTLIVYINSKVNDFASKIQSITNIFAIISVLFVAFQAFLFLKDYRVKNKKAEIEKAIQLAEVYSNEIIKYSDYLLYIYRATKLDKIFFSIKSSLMCEFDKDELDELISQDKQKEISDKLANIDDNILLEARMFLHSKVAASLSDKVDINSYPLIKDDPEYSGKLISRILHSEFNSIKIETLNKLECICMYFNSGIANDNAIYQSLHQTFLKSIYLLYFDIAKLNISGKDKYYTNVIQTFNKWNTMYLEANRRETTLKRNQTHPGVHVNV